LGHNAKLGLKKSIVPQRGTKLGNPLQLGMKPILCQVVCLLQTLAHVSFLILDVFLLSSTPHVSLSLSLHIFGFERVLAFLL
jgi:hypothetical protein